MLLPAPSVVYREEVSGVAANVLVWQYDTLEFKSRNVTKKKYQKCVVMQVKALLQACTHDVTSGGNWYFRISSRKMKSKEVSTQI